MKRDEMLSLILEEMKGIRADIKEVRQTDIPMIKQEVAVIKSESKNTAKIITGVGSIVTLATSAAIAWFNTNG